MRQDAAPYPAAADKILSANYIKLWFGLLFFMLNMSTFNLLPYYLELRGASPDLYGSVAGSMGVSSFLALLVLGHWADYWSRKTTLAVYFMAALAGNLVAIWAMGQPNLGWFFVSRLLQGVFMGVGFPIIFSWAVEVSPANRKHLVLAWIGIGGITANSLGPTLAEMVLALQPEANDPAAYFPVFVMATGFQLVALLFFLSVENKRAAAAEGNGRQRLWPLMRHRESQLVLLIAGSFGGMFGVLMSFGKNYTASLELNYVSVLLWAYSIGAVFSRVFMVRIMRYVAERHLIPLGLLGIGATFLLLGAAEGYPLLGTAGFLYGLSHGVLYPTLFVRYLDFQRPGEIGRAVTLFQGCFSIGWGLLPMMGGAIVGRTNFPSFFSLLAALAGSGIILHLLAERAAMRRRAGAGTS